MIEKGWRRRNDVCPQCHMPGRVGQRFGMDGETLVMLTLVYAEEGTIRNDGLMVKCDICDNCGVMYAFRAD